jgi:hypothetical protein
MAIREIAEHIVRPEQAKSENNAKAGLRNLIFSRA